MEMYIVDPASRLVYPLTFSGDSHELALIMTKLCDGLPMTDFTNFPNTDPTDVLMSIPLELIILEQSEDMKKTQARGAWGYYGKDGEIVPVVGKSIIIGMDMENKKFKTPNISLETIRELVKWGTIFENDSSIGKAILDEDGEIREDWQERLHGEDVKPDAQAVVTAELEMHRIIH